MMGHGKKLTQYERGQIDSFLDLGISINQIALKIGRSRCVVQNYIHDRENYGAKKHKGRRLSYSERDRRIFALTSNENRSVKKITSLLDGKISKSTVRAILSTPNHLKYIKRKSKPPLSNQHREARLTFGRTHMTWDARWCNIIFSDEKKFNLDDPDG